MLLAPVSACLLGARHSPVGAPWRRGTAFQRSPAWEGAGARGQVWRAWLETWEQGTYRPAA